MKVLAFNGSPRKNGNTYHAIQTVFETLKKEGIETELIQLGGTDIRGCRACYKCFEKKNRKCIQNDVFNLFIKKMEEADGIILGSPTYFCNVSTELKALIDRAGLVAIANGYLLRRKVGAAVVAVRRAGATHVYSSINYFFGINHMIIPGSSYWNLGIGMEPGDILKDKEGLVTFRDLGENMAWLLEKLSAGSQG
ncbi:MAG: flavodoxin family protein [Thermodesulfovibrionales bacterium]|nr:flavodoxin family protein [Thermodesulfovibrionales bacterium]